MTDCIFCKIASGEIPSAKYWEDDKFAAILDINPGMKGMTLVMSKEHYDSYLFDLPEDVQNQFLKAARTCAKMLEKAFGVFRVAMVMEGTGVNHCHLKLYPLQGLSAKFEGKWSEDIVYFENYPGYISTQHGPKRTPEELQAMVKEIQEKNK